jgi:tetratricopeptide (TPR) repeat protein
MAEQAVQMVPEHPHPHFILGQAHYVRGNYSEARRSWETASRLEPDNWTWLQTLGDAAFQQADYQASLDYYLRAGRKHPDAISWHGAAGAYWEMGLTEGARDACHQALVLDPDYAPAYISLAMIAEHMGELEDARYYVEQALSLSPDNPANLLAAGRLARLTGNEDYAVSMLNKALGQVPGHPEIRYNLAMALLQVGEGEQAAALLEGIGTEKRESVSEKNLSNESRPDHEVQ